MFEMVKRTKTLKMVKMLNIVEISEQCLKVEIVKMVNNVLNDQIVGNGSNGKNVDQYKFKVIVEVNLI